MCERCVPLCFLHRKSQCHRISTTRVSQVDHCKARRASAERGGGGASSPACWCWEWLQCGCQALWSALADLEMWSGNVIWKCGCQAVWSALADLGTTLILRWRSRKRLQCGCWCLFCELVGLRTAAIHGPCLLSWAGGSKNSCNLWSVSLSWAGGFSGSLLPDVGIGSWTLMWVLASEPWAAAAGDGRRECTNVYSVGCNTYDAACILCMHICLRLSQSPDWVWVDVGDYTGRQRWGEVEGHKDAGRFCLNILFVAHLFSQHCKYIAYCTLVLAALQMYCLLRICSRSTADILLIAHFFLQHCKYIAYCALVLAALHIFCMLRICSCSTAKSCRYAGQRARTALKTLLKSRSCHTFWYPNVIINCIIISYQFHYIILYQMNSIMSHSCHTCVTFSTHVLLRGTAGSESFSFMKPAVEQIFTADLNNTLVWFIVHIYFVYNTCLLALQHCEEQLLHGANNAKVAEAI